MAKSLKIDATVDEDTQIRAEIQYYLDETEKSIERMNKVQDEIDSIKTRTQAKLAELSRFKLTAP